MGQFKKWGFNPHKGAYKAKQFYEDRMRCRTYATNYMGDGRFVGLLIQVGMGTIGPRKRLVVIMPG